MKIHFIQSSLKENVMRNFIAALVLVLFTAPAVADNKCDQVIDGKCYLKKDDGNRLEYEGISSPANFFVADDGSKCYLIFTDTNPKGKCYTTFKEYKSASDAYMKKVAADASCDYVKNGLCYHNR